MAVADLVAKPGTQVMYASRRGELRLVMRARYPRIDASTGRQYGNTQGVTLAFRDGRFFVPHSGSFRVTDPGGAGVADVEAAEVLEFLRAHPLLGDIEEGFWEVNLAAPPVSPEEMSRMMDAAMRLDTDLLEEIIRQEREGWDRDELTSVAQGSLERIQEALEAQAAETRAAESKAKPKG